VSARAGNLMLREPEVEHFHRAVLYPALYRLEQQGLIDSEWGTSENNRRAKFYRLTADGRGRLGDEVASWNRLADAIALALATTRKEI